MAGAERYSIYPGVINGGSLNLQQISGVDISPGTSKAMIVPGGAIDTAAVPTVSADPSVTITTDDLGTVLGGVSLTVGLAISSASSFQFQQREDQGIFSSSAVHHIITVQKGFLAISSITSNQDDEGGATCQLALTALYNGSVDPLVPTTAALTSTPAFTGRYFHGPVYHNSSQVEGIISTTVNPGLVFTARRVDGAVYPSVGAITLRQPTITFTTLKTAATGLANMFHQAITSNLSVYFLKGVTSGTRVGDSTNIKISCTAGDWSQDTISVSDNGDATVSITVRPTSTLAVSTVSSNP
jgi:hypothetical protein